MTQTVTRTLCGMVLLIVTTHAALALPGSPSQRAEMFATCAGRLEAMATRQRADRHPDLAQTERYSADFQMLLEAVMPAAIAMQTRTPLRTRSYCRAPKFCPANVVMAMPSELIVIQNTKSILP